MYNFTKCSYDELQILLELKSFTLSGWSLISREYIDYVYRIDNESGNFIALLYYDIDELRNEICIGFFEVLPEYRGHGYGTEIMKQFLSTLSKSVYLTPQNDEVITFWEKCGFEGNATMFYKN